MQDRAGWAVRYMLVLAGVIAAGIGAGMARPAITYYLRYSLGATLLSATLLTSSFMLGRTLGSMASGLLGLRGSGLRHMLAGLGLLLAGVIVALGIGGAGAPGEVHVFMGLWGLLAGLAWPTVQVGIADLRPGASNTLLSIYFAAGTLGISTGNFLFGTLSLSYRDLIRAGGTLVALSSLLVAAPLAGVRRSQTARGLPRGSGGAGVFLWILLVAFGLGFLSGMLRDYFYLYAREGLGLSRQGLGGVLGVTGLLGVVFGIAAGALADRLGVLRTLPVLVALAGLGALLLSLPSLAICGYVLAAISARASLPQTRNASLLPGGRGAALVGLSNSMSSVGMMSGPIVAGLLGPRSGLGTPYLVAGVLLLVSLLLLPVSTGRHGG